MFAVEPSRFRVGIKQKRLFVVDTELVIVVRGVVNPDPAQVLRYATGITPPVRQTKLYVDLILGSFSNDFVEMYKRIFIPLSGRVAKRVMSRPVSEVSHR